MTKYNNIVLAGIDARMGLKTELDNVNAAAWDRRLGGKRNVVPHPRGGTDQINFNVARRQRVEWLGGLHLGPLVCLWGEVNYDIGLTTGLHAAVTPTGRHTYELLTSEARSIDGGSETFDLALYGINSRIDPRRLGMTQVRGLVSLDPTALGSGGSITQELSGRLSHLENNSEILERGIAIAESWITAIRNFVPKTPAV